MSPPFTPSPHRELVSLCTVWCIPSVHPGPHPLGWTVHTETAAAERRRPPRGGDRDDHHELSVPRALRSVRLCASESHSIASVGFVTRLGPHPPMGIEPVSAVSFTTECDPTDSRTGHRRHSRCETSRHRNVRRVLGESPITDRTRVWILQFHHIPARIAGEISIRGRDDERSVSRPIHGPR